MTEVSKRQYVEKWFSTDTGIVGKNGKENKTDLPLIRLKVRHQTVQILPMDFYKELSQYIGDNYASLCDILEPLVNIKDKEEIATSLIKIMQKLNKSNVFLSEVVMAEVLRLDNNHLTFRGNSIATKSMEAHMKLVGEKYLREMLTDFVQTIIKSEDDCEVDPTKVPIPAMIARNQTNLRMYCDMACTKIFTSFSLFPRELINVFSSFRAKCVEQNKVDLSDNLISASIFLRYLCPAIMSPSLFHLTQEFPSEKAARNLTLIAKTIQTLANFSKFGNKEEYMTFMNEFVELEWNNMKLFLQKISTPDHNEGCTEFDGDIDLGKEMSILHTLLTDSLEKASEEALQKLDNLPNILTKITNDLQNPSIMQHQLTERKSVHYDNLVNIQAHLDLLTSPTELMNNSLNQCDDSYIKLPIGSNGVIVSGPNQRSSNDVDAMVLNSTEYVVSSKNVQLNSEVSNVSVTSQSKLDESHVNKSWNQMVSAAEIINGEYIDLISFMDEDGNHSSREIECNGNGSQMSTILSSGYHSFGYSQCNDLVDTEKDYVNHLTERSPNNYAYSHSTPLSFSNPMYRLNHRGMSSHLKSTSPIVQVSRSSSLSSEEVVTLEPLCSIQGDSSEKQQAGDKVIKKVTPKFLKSCSSPSMSEKIRIAHSIFNNPCTINNMMKDKLPSHSQSNNDVHIVNADNSDRPKHSRSSSNVSFSSRYKESMHFNSTQSTTSNSSNAKYPLNMRLSTPVTKHSGALAPHNVSNYAQYSNTIGSTPRRIHELSHSVDYSFMTQQQQHYADAIRRTAKETVLQHGTGSSQSEKSFGPSPREQFNDDSSLLGSLSGPNAPHIGIRAMQQWLQPQDRSKYEYELEVSVLKQQLVEAQQRLKMAEERLQEHESEAHLTAAEWQIRLQESEEQMRKQQAEKDDQMKNIIQRLFHVEDELRMEQQEMQKVVEQKQKVINAQDRHIQTLNITNNKLVLALNQFKEHYSAVTENGMTGSITRKLTTDISSFKTSSC